MCQRYYISAQLQMSSDVLSTHQIFLTSSQCFFFCIIFFSIRYFLFLEHLATFVSSEYSSFIKTALVSIVFLKLLLLAAILWKKKNKDLGATLQMELNCGQVASLHDASFSSGNEDINSNYAIWFSSPFQITLVNHRYIQLYHRNFHLNLSNKLFFTRALSTYSHSFFILHPPFQNFRLLYKFQLSAATIRKYDLILREQKVIEAERNEENSIPEQK